MTLAAKIQRLAASGHEDRAIVERLDCSLAYVVTARRRANLPPVNPRQPGRKSSERRDEWMRLWIAGMAAWRIAALYDVCGAAVSEAVQRRQRELVGVRLTYALLAFVAPWALLAAGLIIIMLPATPDAPAPSTAPGEPAVEAPYWLPERFRP